MAILPGGRLVSNGDVEFAGGDGACPQDSPGRSASVNALQGLAAPEKQRGVGRPTNSREKAPYEGLSKRTRFCSICRREGHKRTTCPDRGDAPKKPRKPGKCKNCGMEGHSRTTCTRPATWCRREILSLNFYFCTLEKLCNVEDFLVCFSGHLLHACSSN